ncbi:MAG: pentapeptide repeat-containing protein [Pseudomonadota bacterium]
MVQPTVFISYKHDDDATQKAVAKVEAILAELGLTPLRDPKLQPGDLWSNELYRWMMECSAGIALIGEEPAKSEWCRREWWFLSERARSDANFRVIPISVDGTSDSAGILKHVQAAKIDIQDLTAQTLQGWKSLENLRPSPDSYLTAHRAWLRWQFNDAPMWGREPFSLKDVYVETECGKLDWGEISDRDNPKDPFKDDDENGGRNDLAQTAMDLILDPGFREPIVIQGAPGAGKSAFTLKIANELMERGLQPILVRFRDFLLEHFQVANELIEDAMRIGSSEDQPPRPTDPILTEDLLNKTAETDAGQVSDIVFILDGWDEVSLTGSTSFQAQLTTWLPKLRDYANIRRNRPVRLILTGRPSSDVKDSGILNKSTPILTVRHMRPDALRDYAQRLTDHLAAAPEWDDPWYIDPKDIDILFETYAKWFENQDEEDGKDLDVLGSPLLAFLALRTLSDWDGDPDELVEEPTYLYQVLIDTTVKHGGQGRDTGLKDKTVHQKGDPLRYLLQRTASIISILGQESATFKELNLRLAVDPEFERHFGKAGLREAVNEQERLSTLMGLVVSFFFKGGNESLGCEFLHKSFREFLFADSILQLLRELSEGQSGGLEAPDVAYFEDFKPGELHYDATRGLSELLSPQWLTKEVKTHLFWLIKQDIAADTDRWLWLRDLILDVYIWWAEGVHLRPQRVRQRRGDDKWEPAYMQDMQEHALPFDMDAPANPQRSAALDAALGEALMEIGALIHAELLDHPAQIKPDTELRQYYRADPGGARFAPGGESHFKSLMARINASGWRSVGEFAQSAGEGTFAGLAALSKVSLQKQQLISSEFFATNLREANLSQADLYKANLYNADLREANLSGASMQMTDLREAYLREADLSGADLSEANLSGANLFEADLRRANLSRADLSRANLSGAKLHRTDCSRINIDSSRLQFADLSEAIELTQDRVNAAHGNSKTKLPPGLTRPDHWQN